MNIRNRTIIDIARHAADESIAAAMRIIDALPCEADKLSALCIALTLIESKRGVLIDSVGAPTAEAMQLALDHITKMQIRDFEQFMKARA